MTLDWPLYTIDGLSFSPSLLDDPNVKCPKNEVCFGMHTGYICSFLVHFRNTACISIDWFPYDEIAGSMFAGEFGALNLTFPMTK